MWSPSLSLPVMMVTVASVVMGVLKSWVVPLTVIAKAALARFGLIFAAMSKPLTPLSIFRIDPSGNFIATIIKIPLYCLLVIIFCRLPLRDKRQ